MGDFRGIPFLSLKHDHCRYPQGGDDGAPILFCGQPKAEGSSYCAACRARCVVSPPKISDEERERRSEAARQQWARRRMVEGVA